MRHGPTRFNLCPDREVKRGTIAAVHEKRIEIRWRDFDAYRHVNNAVYATYLEECRDELVAFALGEAGDSWGYVLARVAIDYRRELTQADSAVVVRCSVERIGNSSITLREEIRTPTGDLAAEAEAVLVARDPETGRSRPLTEAERTAFESALDEPEA
jgi:acyl-CoA thioester hydrolase